MFTSHYCAECCGGLGNVFLGCIFFSADQTMIQGHNNVHILISNVDLKTKWLKGTNETARTGEFGSLPSATLRMITNINILASPVFLINGRRYTVSANIPIQQPVSLRS